MKNNKYISYINIYMKFITLIVVFGFLIWLCFSALGSYVVTIENDLYQLMAVAISIGLTYGILIFWILERLIEDIVTNKYLQSIGKVLVIIVFFLLYKFIGILEISIV
ncbi:hypothetical protein [Dethiothermospora halolimnae]|uniref:hypothetical protein n=1 Tax=Dethiothermospora halolimnae TaxID=3114390 RepID=UPI003CCC0D62